MAFVTHCKQKTYAIGLFSITTPAFYRKPPQKSTIGADLTWGLEYGKNDKDSAAYQRRAEIFPAQDGEERRPTGGTNGMVGGEK